VRKAVDWPWSNAAKPRRGQPQLAPDQENHCVLTIVDTVAWIALDDSLITLALSIGLRSG